MVRRARGGLLSGGEIRGGGAYRRVAPGGAGDEEHFR